MDTIVDNTNEEPEGIDNSPDLEMHNYPLDNLLIRDVPRSVYEVCRRIEQGQYIMDPDFQRDFVWGLDKQSSLIESLLMRIPLPVFYLAERYDGRIIVIDGLQRLTTISRYLKNEFALRGLGKTNISLLGKKFQDLPVKLQNRLEDTRLIMYVLDEKVPERARLDIFERVNGGTPLSRQQMRNCMYCGEATRMLKALAMEKSFLGATGNSLSKKTMRDREFINRYMAFKVIGLDNYRGDMDDFLASALQKINTMTKNETSELKEKFVKTMHNCELVWGRQTFRKHKPNQSARNVINAALFDVLSFTIERIKGSFNADRCENIRRRLFGLFDDEQFDDAITLSTNDLSHVSLRFQKAKDAFKGV
ncbi:MAG: DUF262 domain-containing protein [Spirochaetaceae bacterium]|jgi:hypothetical protein|nr:DUF262 domain-containing protein [Spirochaetaceae bacterium]